MKLNPSQLAALGSMFVALALLLMPVSVDRAAALRGDQFVRVRSACAQGIDCNVHPYAVCFTPDQPERPLEGWENKF
jgi:hypothetical protein